MESRKRETIIPEQQGYSEKKGGRLSDARRGSEAEKAGYDVDEVPEQVKALLQRQKRVSYRGLKWRFALDDEYLADLKEEFRRRLTD